MISRAIDSWLVALLGFLFLPWTTLAYVVFYESDRREVAGFEWFLVGLAFLIDLGSYMAAGPPVVRPPARRRAATGRGGAGSAASGGAMRR